MGSNYGFDHEFKTTATSAEKNKQMERTLFGDLLHCMGETVHVEEINHLLFKPNISHIIILPTANHLSRHYFELLLKNTLLKIPFWKTEALDMECLQKGAFGATAPLSPESKHVTFICDCFYSYFKFLSPLALKYSRSFCPE